MYVCPFFPDVLSVMGKVLDKRSAVDVVKQVSFVKLGTRKALSFLWPLVQLHLRVYHETVRLESEERRGNVRLLRHRLHHLQSCSWRSGSDWDPC